MPKEPTLFTWSISRLLLASPDVCRVWPYPVINHFSTILNNSPDFLAPLAFYVQGLFSCYSVMNPYHHSPFPPTLSTKPCTRMPSAYPYSLLSVVSEYKPTVVFLHTFYFIKSHLHSLFQLMTLPPTLVRGSRASSVVRSLTGSHLLLQYLWSFIILFPQDISLPFSTFSSYLGVYPLYFWSLSFPLVPSVISFFFFFCTWRQKKIVVLLVLHNSTKLIMTV